MYIWNSKSDLECPLCAIFVTVFIIVFKEMYFEDRLCAPENNKMRIPYFNKYITNNVLRDYILEDCPLVIDGHQFFYNLYEDNKLPFEFGSEANEYARCLLRRPLNMLRKANIKCVFVFKGGDVDIEKKKSRLPNVNFDFESNNNYVSPIFLREVCLQILDEIGLNYSTCVMETIDDCVILAQLFDCPVLSSGIAYYFRRVPFIPINTLRYSNPNDYIYCKEYKLTEFLNTHSITEKKAAIFAALTDINLFPSNNFDNLFKEWNVFSEISDTQFKNLLQWLSEHTEDEALSKIEEFLSSEVDYKKFCDQLDKLLDNMENANETVVTDYLYNYQRLTISQADPLWFDKGVAAQKIAIPYINLYKHKFILGSRAIESKGSIDSIMLSIDIIKYAYNLLTNYKTTDIFVYRDAENYIKVNTGDTMIRRPTYKCDESVFENGWMDVKHLKLFEHFLYENNINIDKVELPDDARVLFIALTYFSRQKLIDGVNVTKEVYCSIVCYVMLEHLILSYHRCNVIRCQQHGIYADDFNEAGRIMSQYFVCDTQEVQQIFDGDVLKPLVELQHCLLHMNYLNELCGAPYLPTKYHTTFNGTFIYKLLRAMSDCNPYVLIQNLFKRTPSVLAFINKLISVYQELCM